MFSRRIKLGAFLLEGFNSISTVYYFYYVFFFLKHHFGFGSRENLWWAVAHGTVYVLASWQGGRFGQRFGYLRAVQLGFGGMAVCFLLGWWANRSGLSREMEIAVQALLMLIATLSMCFTWPSLEAIVSEGESGLRLQRFIGIYNLVWSGCGAVAYFTGGALIERFGYRVIFTLPAAIIAGQFLYVTWLGRQPGAGAPLKGAPAGPVAAESERQRSPLSPRTFLRMSWLANPCAYVAISAAVPLIPTLAEKLGLGPRLAGFFCSTWFFARTLTFLLLWRWSGWHYRFRWLAMAYLGMIVGFLFIFLIPGFARLSLAQVLVLSTVAQIIFGAGLGLIYYSSLFYSMDVGETKGDHGGIHEAAIGMGILGGPVVGAAAQWAGPGTVAAAVWAVSGVLLGGFAALLRMRYRRDRVRD